jgi:hypothetical protein
VSEKNNEIPIELSQDQIRRLLKMEEEFARCKWLYGMLATVAMWIAGIVTVIYTTQDFILKLYKALRTALGGP